MQEQQYLPVNWTDGMKINKSHFIAQDNAVMNHLAHNASSLLNECSYGLLPSPENSPGISFFISMDNQQQIQLRIRRCRAFTRGGHYIQLDEDTSMNSVNMGAALAQLSVSLQELQQQASEFYIVISINPYQRVPFGLADLSESPTRLPYSRPSYDLSLVPLRGKNLLGLYQLSVGKLKVDSQRVLIDEQYIPPCSALNSHYELLEFHAHLEQFYSKMEIFSLQIIQKIQQKKQTNEMAAIVLRLCESVNIFTALQLTEVKTLSLFQPPVYIINKVSSLARLVKNTLDYYTGTGKEEFMNYCSEWCNMIQGELEATITHLNNQVYEHLDIKKSIEKVFHFTKGMIDLFSSLDKLDYIGKRKDAGIFVKEKPVLNEAEPIRKHISFLAD